MNFFNPYNILTGSASCFWIAFLVSALLAFPIYKLLLSINARQTVSKFLGESHQKKQGTPTMGGLIVIPGLAVALALGGLYYDAGLMLAFGAIGFIDDFLIPRVFPGKRGLGWGQKLILELIVGFLFLIPLYQKGQLGNLDLSTLPIPFILCITLGVILLLAYVNAFNFSDGLDALAGGLGLVLAVGMGMYASIAVSIPGSIWIGGAAMAGSIIPFLFLNSPPAKIFMGDVGSLAIGSIIGLNFIRLLLSPVGASCSWISNFFFITIMSLILIIELILVPIQIGSVKIFKKRLSIRTPIHHTFEHMGVPETKIVSGFLLTQFLLICLAISLNLWCGGNC